MYRRSRIHLRNQTFDLILHPVKAVCKRRNCVQLVLVVACLILIGSAVSQFYASSPGFGRGKTLDLQVYNWTSCSIVRSIKTAAETVKPVGKKVPKILHQTYKNTKMPSGYRDFIAKCRNLNPDWKYYLWRDEDIESFMDDHFPGYKQKYQKFTMNVQRADFIRYMVLYYYGGVYLDMDVECVKPFFPSIENEMAFIDQERKEHAQILYNVEYMAMNSAMGSVVGHPFYLRMLESVVNADDKLSGAGITTGPDRLTMVYREWAGNSQCMKEYPVTLMEPVMFSPIADTKLHNFSEKCQKSRADKHKWIHAGCQLLSANNWKADATDNGTVARHLFLHMGYDWGPKSKSFFDAAKLGPLALYKVDRM